MGANIPGMPYAVDRFGTLTNKRRTPTNGYLVDAKLARTGVLKYPGRTTLNTAEVLQSSLDAVSQLPVTFKHPERMVTPDTYKAVNCGNPTTPAAFDGQYITTTLAIQDKELIEAVDSGEATEVSMGYWFEEAATPGEYEGQAYDTVRTAIKWNHIAIVPKGRAGASVCLALDSEEIPSEETMKVKIKIAGKEQEMDAQSAVDTLQSLLDVAQDKLSAAEKAAQDAQEELAQKTSQEALDALVQARAAKDAADRELAAKREAVKKAYPNIALDSKSDETISALFDTLQSDQSVMDAAPGKQNPGQSAPAEKKKEAPKKSARDEMEADLARRASARKDDSK